MTDKSDQAIDKIVIVGGGTAGWMTAAALAVKLRNSGVSVKLIESAEIGTVGVGEATLPQIRDFNKMLDISDADIMSRTAATIKLGIEFCDWGRKGDHYIHPFGTHGHAMGVADFHQYWLRACSLADIGNFGSYCLPIEAAREDRFDQPHAEANKAYLAYSYAFQFDASLYAKFLADFACERGVEHIEGKIVSTSSDSENGFIQSVTLESGETIEAHLFVDCSGFRGLLIEQELKTGYQDWSCYLPCNRAFAVPCKINGTIGPFTRSTARTAGWQWRIPLQHRIGNGHVYCNDYVSDQDAVDLLMQNLEGEAIAEPKQLFFLTGKRKRLWNKNCIAIGLSGGFLEPLESTSIDLIQSGILNLIKLFPDKHCDPLDVQEYNRLMDLEYDRIRDFLMLHYVLNQRDEVFWQDMQNMEWPDSLREKIEAFQKRGLVPKNDLGLFQPDSWLSVFIGQNLNVQSLDQRVYGQSQDELLNHLSEIKSDIASSVSQMSFHRDHINKSGGAFSGTDSL